MFSIQLIDKTIYVNVEFFDTTLDYSMILGRSWFYAMSVVVSSVFCFLCFPNESKIVIIDQLDYSMPSTKISTMVNSIPHIGDNPSEFHSFAVGIFISSTLMGVFPQLLPPSTPSTSPTPHVYMIFSRTCGP